MYSEYAQFKVYPSEHAQFKVYMCEHAQFKVKGYRFKDGGLRSRHVPIKVIKHMYRKQR